MQTLSFATDVAGTGVAGWLLLWVLKGSLLLALLFPLSALLHRASSSTRHLVWTAGLSIAVLLPVLSGVLPWRLELPQSLSAPFAARVSDDVGARQADRLGSTLPPLEFAPPQDAAAAPTHGPGRTSQDENTAASTAPGREPWTRARVLNTALLVWLAGAALLLLRLALSRRYVRRLVNAGTPLTDPSWTTPLIEVADRLDLPDLPRLVVNADAAMPLTCGVTKPAIVLPPSAAEWTDERRRAVLCHELAHVRRRDLLTHLLGRIACALYWFQPLAWSAARRLRAESERAADDLVLITGTRPSTYADHLLQIVTSVKRVAAPVVALPMAQPREFEARLLSILEPGRRREPLPRLHAASLMLLVAAIALPLVALAPAPPAGASTLPLLVEREDEQEHEPVFHQPAPHAATQAAPMPAADPAAVAEPDTGRQRQRTFSESIERNAERFAIDIVDFTTATLSSVLRGVTGQEQEQDPRVRAALIRALGDASPEVARSAAWALASHRDSAVVRALAGAVRSAAHASVREMAVWALVEQGAAARPVARDALTQALTSDQDAEVRATAAWGLGNVRDPAGLPALERAARTDSDADVRMAAAWALGQIAAESSVPALTEALTYARADVRQAAAWSLGQIAPRPAPANLVAALRDADRQVRTVAAWSLGRIADPATAPALRNAMADSSTEVRRAAIWAVGRFSGDAAIDALTAALTDSNPEVRAAAAAALGGRGSEPWPWPWPWPQPRISP